MAVYTSVSPSGAILSNDTVASIIPAVTFDKITLDLKNQTTGPQGRVRSSLAIDLDMSMNIRMSNSLFSSNVDLIDHMNIRVVRSTSTQESKRIETSENAGTLNTGAEKEIFHGPLKNILKDNKSQNQETKVSFQREDTIEDSENIPHLSYYAFCYLDLESLAKTLGITNVPALGPTTGPLAGERVISSGRVNSVSYVFYVRSQFPEELRGTFWSGPVLEIKNGKAPGTWCAARWMPTPNGAPQLKQASPKIDLEKIEVENTKIQDLRILRKMPSLNVNLVQSRTSPIVIKGRDVFDNSIENPDAYISNAFLSRDRNNNCKFIFEFDYENTLIKESKFGKILTNPFVSRETKQKISLYSKITNLQITRRQVEVARGYNRLSSANLGISRSELNLETQIIVETYSDQSKNNALKEMRAFGAGRFLKGNKKNNLIGGIKELPPISNSPRQTKTIAVTDTSIRDLTDGTFQYGVKIQIEDGTIRFLNERLKRLRSIREYLVGYYNLVQIPTKSYERIKSVKEYYDVLLDELSSHRRDRVDREQRAEIAGLGREMGMLIGNLKDKERLYPWILAPAYIVDTLTAISDFSFLSTSKRIQTSSSLMTTQAKLESNSETGIAPTNPEMGTSAYFDPISQKQKQPGSSGYNPSLGLPMKTVGSKKSTLEGPTRDQGPGLIQPQKYSSSFDPKSAAFSLRSSLNPAIATSETILSVIDAIDLLTQKIRDMMGPSAEIEIPDSSTKRRGTPRNSKVSVIELEDYFVELFDARLSTFPSVDYIGFANSRGTKSVPNPPAGTPYAAQGDLDSLNADKMALDEKETTVAAVTVGTFEDRLEDEEGMVEAAKSAVTSAPLAPEDSQELTGVQHTILPSPAQAPVIPQITPGILDANDGTYIVRSIAVDNYDEPSQYAEFQNKVVAQSIGHIPSTNSTNQGNLGHLMSVLNVQVEPIRTPMAAQENLTKGQNKISLNIPVSDILGPDDLQSKSTRPPQGASCDQSSTTDDGATAMELYKNESNAGPLFQELANIMATNGKFDTSTPRANGSPSRGRAGRFIKNRSNSTSSPKDSPKQSLTQGMAANISVFAGYKNDSNGNFMIKRPVFKTPTKEEWSKILRNLKNKNNKSDVLLCMVERKDNPDTPFGLNMVEVNTYFLITRNEASLSAPPGSAHIDHRGSETGRAPSREAKRSVKEPKGATIEEIPTQALKSISVGSRKIT